MYDDICDVTYVLLLLLQAKQLEVERTQKWLKMRSSWDKYFPGEKVISTSNG